MNPNLRAALAVTWLIWWSHLRLWLRYTPRFLSSSTLAHDSRQMRSCCSTTLSSMLLMTLCTKASSLKSLTEVHGSMTDGMSFIYRRNSSGPNTVPCGTPRVTVKYSDFNPSHKTSWQRFMRKDSIQRRTLPWIPYRASSGGINSRLVDD